jgi:hypothetical protein
LWEMTFCERRHDFSIISSLSWELFWLEPEKIQTAQISRFQIIEKSLSDQLCCDSLFRLQEWHQPSDKWTRHISVDDCFFCESSFYCSWKLIWLSIEVTEHQACREW